MTTTTPLRHQKRTTGPGPWRRALLSWPAGRILVMVIAMAGAGVLLYGPTLNWFQDLNHATAISGYAQQQTSGQAPQDVQQKLAAAHAYNTALPAGGIQDPYAAGPSGRQTATGGAATQYFHTLNLGPGGLMGVLTVPKIDVNLPIYHGTSAQTLDTGVGHLYGSALPVGGEGTHAVLTGHSGVVGDTLFTNLHKLRLGDTFTVTVLNQSLTYQVDQIKTVLPNQTDDLAAVPGKDYVTLLTCTPIGVNTHRLLVRGERVPTPAGAATAQQVLANASAAGFPWWALMALGSFAAGTALTAPLATRTPHRHDHTRQEARA